MNPFRWRPEHQVAGVIACLVGAIAGIFFAWMESPFRSMSVHTISGDYADYTGVFLTWLWYGHYWPWPLLGSVIAGLTFYAAQLLRTQN
jgi:hypothetical protein